MHLDESAAVDGPYQTGATGIVERPPLQHLRQIGAYQVAALLHPRVISVRTVGTQIGDPLGHIPVASVLRNELGERTTLPTGKRIPLWQKQRNAHASQSVSQSQQPTQ